MRFTSTTLDGVWRIELDRHEDERGFFARAWCRKEFEERGLNAELAQCSIACNHQRGTLRGMHWQIAPHAEAKLVRCIRGAIFDVVVDLRPGSKTYGQWQGVELSADNHEALYVPEGLAHGFQALASPSEVFYQISEFFHPDFQRGFRWDDPAVGIQWPVHPPILSPRDKALPNFAAI